jgi:hypothetical protein
LAGEEFFLKVMAMGIVKMKEFVRNERIMMENDARGERGWSFK